MELKAKVVHKDGTTEVVSIPRGSYLNLNDPRELPSVLLRNGSIDEERAEEMRSQIEQRTPAFVKETLTFKVKDSNENQAG